MVYSVVFPVVDYSRALSSKIHNGSSSADCLYSFADGAKEYNASHFTPLFSTKEFRDTPLYDDTDDYCVIRSYMDTYSSDTACARSSGKACMGGSLSPVARALHSAS